MSDKEYRRLYDMLDPDGSGCLTYQEFQVGQTDIKHMFVCMTPQSTQTLFSLHTLACVDGASLPRLVVVLHCPPPSCRRPNTTSDYSLHPQHFQKEFGETINGGEGQVIRWGATAVPNHHKAAKEWSELAGFAEVYSSGPDVQVVEGVGDEDQGRKVV